VCNYPRNRQQDTIRRDKRFAIASSKRAQVSWHSFDLHQARLSKTRSKYHLQAKKLRHMCALIVSMHDRIPGSYP